VADRGADSASVASRIDRLLSHSQLAVSLVNYASLLSPVTRPAWSGIIRFNRAFHSTSGQRLLVLRFESYHLQSNSITKKQITVRADIQCVRSNATN
jgi:hypothetical protein